MGPAIESHGKAGSVAHFRHCSGGAKLSAARTRNAGLYLETFQHSQIFIELRAVARGKATNVSRITYVSSTIHAGAALVAEPPRSRPKGLRKSPTHRCLYCLLAYVRSR
jgi:hypothetical protein